MMAQQQLDTNSEPDRVTEVCPHCEKSRSVYHRREDDEWICWECGSEFDEPLRRERRSGPLNMNRTQRFLWGCPPSASIDDLPELYEEFEDDPEGWI